jgi:hypothetical protein
LTVANVKITQLPPVTAVTGGDFLEGVQGGTSVRLTAQQIADYVRGAVFGTVIPVDLGGTGSQSLTGYVFGSGVDALQGRPSIPNTDISGLGTGSTVNIHVGTTPPPSPSIGDLWVDTN